MAINQNPSPLPAVVRRQYRWLLLSVLLTGSSALYVSIFGLSSVGAVGILGMFFVFLACLVLPTCVTVVVLYFNMRKIKRKVQDASGRACTSCLHDLSGLKDSGRCPECGLMYDTQALNAMWSRARCLKTRERSRQPESKA